MAYYDFKRSAIDFKLQYTIISKYMPSGIGSNSWLDVNGVNAIGVNGAPTFHEGADVQLNGNNNLYMNVPKSTLCFGVRCKINSDYQPTQSNIWYGCSCVMGRELSGTQKDFAIIIDKNGYFALGYGNASINSSNIYACDGEEHTLFIICLWDRITLFIDGVKKIEQLINVAGSDISNIGIFFNLASGARVSGMVYACGVWSYEGSVLSNISSNGISLEDIHYNLPSF